MKIAFITTTVLAAAITTFAAAEVHAQEGAGVPEWLPRGDNLYFLEMIGIGTSRPKYPLHVQTVDDKRAICAINKMPDGVTYGVYALNYSTGAGATGVYGRVNSTSAGSSSAGVRGVNRGTGGSGIGVWGSHAGSGWGVLGESVDGIGVLGRVTANAIGVKGESDMGYAVFGESDTGIGVIGISTTYFGVYGVSSGAYSIYADGDLFALEGYKPGGGSWSVPSDVRLKKNIETLDGALDTLLALRGVTFEYRDPEAINEISGERIGFIAQEVEEVIPDWVSERKDGYKAVTVRGFEALTVEALREVKRSQDAAIARLTLENEDLNERLAQLEAIVARLAANPQ